jgi:hypothetical protein
MDIKISVISDIPTYHLSKKKNINQWEPYLEKKQF